MRIIRENALLGLTAIFFFILGFTTGYSDTPRFDAYQGNQFKVVGVYSGQIIKIEGHGLIIQVRLAGLDAPDPPREKSHPGQPYGLEAGQYLSNLINGRTVSIVGHGLSRYNQVLAEVFLENKNINLAMIEAGLAEVSKGKWPKSINIGHYKIAEQEARKKKRGMWGRLDDNRNLETVTE